MNSSLERLEKSRVKIVIELTPEELEEGVKVAYKKVAQQVAVPGFRKGKAPRKLIENYYGESVFYEEAVNYLFPKHYQDAVKQHGIEPVEQPDVSIDDIGADVTTKFSAEVDVRPEVTLGKTAGLEAVKPAVIVTDDQIDAEIKAAMERVAREVDAGRPVQDGDRVMLDYSGSVDGVKFEGGTAESQFLTIGSGQFIPGFEEQMIGLDVGEERDLTVKFPEEYHSKELAGKDAVFRVKVHAVKTKEMPALDDEFAKDVSEFETLEEYKKSIRDRLTEQAEKRAEDDFENALIDALSADAKVDVPNALVEQVIDQQLQMMDYRFRMQGLNLEQFLQYTGQTIDAYRAQFRPEAEKRARNELCLSALREELKLEADDASLDELIRKRAESVKKDFAEYKASLKEHDLEHLREGVIGDKLIDHLKSSAIVLTKEAGV